MHATTDKKELIEEEIFFIENSGEIPEVDFHNALHYLCEEENGPGISLSEQEMVSLKKAVAARYKVIILRDLDPENRDKRKYRGVARSLANWQRFCAFSRRESLNGLTAAIRSEVALALRFFLEQEVRDFQDNRRPSSVNCCLQEFDAFLQEMGILKEDRPQGWQKLCQE